MYKVKFLLFSVLLACTEAFADCETKTIVDGMVYCDDPRGGRALQSRARAAETERAQQERMQAEQDRWDAQMEMQQQQEESRREAAAAEEARQRQEYNDLKKSIREATDAAREAASEARTR